MRKRLFIIGLIMTLSLSACTTTSAQMKSEVKIQETEVRNNETSTVAETVSVMEDAEAENLSLSDYMKTVYKAADNEYYDELCYKALDMYEKNDGKKKYIYVCSGDTKEDCNYFTYYFNMCFGYTNDIRLTTMKLDNKWYSGFYDVKNEKENIKEYLRIAKKAQDLSKTLVGASTDETINNTIAWIENNATYNYDVDETKDVSEVISAYYGIYEKKPVICGGYSIGLYQLCRMNGIKATVLMMKNNETNTGHGANYVTFSTGKKYVDSLYKKIEDSIPTKYTVFFNSSENN